MSESPEIAVNENIPAEKLHISFTKAEKIYAAVIALLAFLYVEFEIFNPAGFFTTAVNFLIITASIIFLKKHDCKLTAYNKMIAVVLYLFSCVFSITDNGFIKFLDGVFLFFAGAYFVYSAAEGKKNMEQYLPFALIKAVFEFPFSQFGAEANAAKEVVGNSKSAGNIKYIVCGLLLALPVTALVAALLISADKGMEDFFTNISSNMLSAESVRVLCHFLVSIPCGLYLYGMLYANCKRNNLNILDKNLCEYTLNGARVIPNIILYTAVTPVLLLYIMFFISQGSYFLSAFSGDLPEGYSYAEYARRGFFELCAVTVINLFVICFISLLAQKSGKNKPTGLKFYSTALSVSTLILIAVAVSKMVMYISEYGLTRLRFYTMWFMTLCALIFVLIIVKQFKFNMNFAAWSSGVFTVMFAVLCFCSPDFVIAKYNVEMYNAGYIEELDRNQICSMSNDAVLYALEEGAIDEEMAYDANRSLFLGKNKKILNFMNVPSVIIYEKLKNAEIS